MSHRVVFLEPKSEIDDIGGRTNSYTEKFERWASYVRLRGGEEIIADRMEGVLQSIITVRSSPTVDAVTTDWRIKDVTTGEEFNIGSITKSDNGLYLSIAAKSGVAG